MIGKFFACGCLAASLFATSPIARAGETNTPVQNPELQSQRRPARQENLNGGRGPLGFPGAAITSPVAVLTPEQRTSFQTALRAQRGRMLELDGKLRTARHEMDEASVTGTFNETLIREKALA